VLSVCVWTLLVYRGIRRNSLDQKLVEKLVRGHTNLVLRESLDDTLGHLLPWDICWESRRVYVPIICIQRIHTSWLSTLCTHVCTERERKREREKEQRKQCFFLIFIKKITVAKKNLKEKCPVTRVTGLESLSPWCQGSHLRKRPIPG
jgi:hypothetical protein